MEKLTKYYGILLFVVVVGILGYISYSVLLPKFDTLSNRQKEVIKQNDILTQKNLELARVSEKIKKMQYSIATSTKKVYYPSQSDLGDDTLFFTIYNDVVDMLKSNSIKIKTIDYVYNPEKDKFVEFGKDKYFVCDVNMDLISNYVNFGKFIEALYQYPYYVRINQVYVNPYENDKKILMIKLSLRLYAHTQPEEIIKIEGETIN